MSHIVFKLGYLNQTPKMADGAMQCYRNHYTFGMPPEFSIPDFVRAFRRVAKKLHPDRNPNKSEEVVFFFIENITKYLAVQIGHN